MKNTVIITPQNRQDVLELVRNTPDYWVVEIRSKDRTVAQNRFYWATLRQISESIMPTNKKYSPDVWHCYMKELFISNTLVELPTGELIEREKTTTRLTKDEFTDYISQVLAWANEHGVRWSDEMFEHFNHAEMQK